MQGDGIDRITARALVDAGYMPLAQYIRLFGGDHEAPTTVPSLDDMDTHPSPQKTSIFSHLLDILHLH